MGIQLSFSGKDLTGGILDIRAVKKAGQEHLKKKSDATRIGNFLNSAQWPDY